MVDEKNPSPTIPTEPDLVAPPPPQEEEEEISPQDLENLEGGNGDTEDLPPLRMHATRVQQRLSASGKMIMSDGLATKQHQRRRSLKDALPRSRSRSPSMKNTETTFDAGSSISSLQDLEDLDPDILLDKAGFEELNPIATQASVKDLQASVSSLPPVNERLSNDDLEDVHAFSDVNVSKASSSRGGSVADDAALALETLDEEEGEDDAVENKNNGRPEVILENMENLELDDKEEKQANAGGSHSVPTA